MTLVYSFTCLGLTKCSTFGAVVDYFRGRSSFLYVTFKWKTRRMNTPKKYSKYMLKLTLKGAKGYSLNLMKARLHERE